MSQPRHPWSWDPFIDRHNNLVDEYNALLRDWNKFIPEYNALVRKRPVGVRTVRTILEEGSRH